jgi:hypothetical protein
MAIRLSRRARGRRAGFVAELCRRQFINTPAAVAENLTSFL